MQLVLWNLSKASNSSNLPWHCAENTVRHTARSRYAPIPLWHISQQEPFYFRSVAWQGTASSLKLFP